MAERRTRRIPIGDQLPLTASAQVLTPIDEDRGRRNLFQYASWQDEAWSFWRSLGEFNFAEGWLSNTISRVRLIAAESLPGGDEPAPLPNDHPASHLVAAIGGSVAGQAALMKAWTTHVTVTGDSWTVVEQVGARQKWQVHSAKTIREPKKKNAPFQVQVSDTQWRPVGPESTTMRIWTPDPEFHWRAFSFAEAALPIMRAVDLYNRRIIATLVSRIAMNGFLIVPAEMTFQSRPEFKDAPDPFIAELIEHASYAIKNPGTASAAIPFPVKIPAQLAKEFRHMALDNGVDEKLVEARDAELRRLATTVHMPAEVLLGMGDTTHWNAWQISEEGIKTFISPRVEVYADGITEGWVVPGLEAANEPLVGPNGGAIICWYDPSEITAKPDKTQSALDLYDRGELDGKTLRQEAGFEEASKPNKSALKDWTLKQLVKAPATSVAAAKELTGLDLAPPAPVQPELPFGEPEAVAEDEPLADETRGLPATEGEQPVAASAWLRRDVNGRQPALVGR